MRRIQVVLCLLAALPVIVCAAPAARAAGNPAAADCVAHGRLTQHYTVAALQNAIATMSSEVKQYTDCYDVLYRQLLAQASGTVAPVSGSGSSGGSFLPTPVLIVLILLVLAAGGLGIVALRRRR
jgi:hypothetical protein